MIRELSTLRRGWKMFSLGQSARGRFAVMRGKNHGEEEADLRRDKWSTSKTQLFTLSWCHIVGRARAYSEGLTEWDTFWGPQVSGLLQLRFLLSVVRRVYCLRVFVQTLCHGFCCAFGFWINSYLSKKYQRNLTSVKSSFSATPSSRRFTTYTPSSSTDGNPKLRRNKLIKN